MEYLKLIIIALLVGFVMHLGMHLSVVTIQFVSKKFSRLKTAIFLKSFKKKRKE